MKRFISIGSALLLTLVIGAAPAAAAAPTMDEFTEGPGDEVVVDCGSYQIHEVATFSARTIAYSDGTVRVHATLDGWLYRSDDPDTVIGRERAVTVRLIEGSVVQVTGNRWHIVVYGSGMTVHDVGRLVFNFETGEVVTESGKHPVFFGEFDFSTLCDL
jgi:anti-sigma factor RsiW